LQVFPNPTTGKITISLDEPADVPVNIIVTDIAGRNVMEINENSIGGFIQLSLPTYLKGNYFIRCNINGRTGVNKIIVNP
jgi:hypothetical protein